MSEHISNKLYTRFNKEKRIFEDIILAIDHQERLEGVILGRNRVISIGDLVRVMDGSGNLDYDKGKRRHGVDALFKENSALVIETDLSFITEPLIGIGEKSRYVLNLLLLFPGGERVYTTSTFVRLANNEEWKYHGTTWPKWETIR
jgi:hypothetical protein